MHIFVSPYMCMHMYMSCRFLVAISSFVITPQKIRLWSASRPKARTITPL